MHCGPLKMRLFHSAKHCDLLYSDYEMLLRLLGNVDFGIFYNESLDNLIGSLTLRQWEAACILH